MCLERVCLLVSSANPNFFVCNKKDPNFDLQLTNSQSNEDYHNESAMIPANTSLIVRRVPVKSRGKKFDQPHRAPIAASNQTPSSNAPSLPLLAGGGEGERIDALISQGPGWTHGQHVPQRPKFMQGGNVLSNYCLYSHIC
jgi:hypothetical protein